MVCLLFATQTAVSCVCQSAWTDSVRGWPLALDQAEHEEVSKIYSNCNHVVGFHRPKEGDCVVYKLTKAEVGSGTPEVEEKAGSRIMWEHYAHERETSSERALCWKVEERC